MKKIILLLLAISVLGCSSDNSSEDISNNIPEKFDIKVEIKSIGGTSPDVLISVNSLVKKKWSDVNLPFQEEYTYFTIGNETSNTSCKCINISAWAYISKLYNIESFNLYVNGKLVDSTKIVAEPQSNGIMNPTILNFVYNP